MQVDIDWGPTVRSDYERHQQHTRAGARIRQARVRAGMSLRTLATRLAVSPATISQIENDRTRLTLQRLEGIAEALQTTPQDILNTAAGPESSEPAKRSARTPQEIPADPTPDWRTYPPLPFSPLLQAALTEFVRTGYHGTTVRAIAERAGLSVAGLYHHHSSKHDMLVTILEYAMNELLRRSRAARVEGVDPVQRFALLIEHLALFHTHRLELGFVGASEMRSLAPVNRRHIADMRTDQQNMVDREVDEAITLGLFSSPRPHDASRAVVTMCTALPQWFRRDGPQSPEEIAASYVGFGLDLLGSAVGDTSSHNRLPC